ncbi:NAD(P)/FAD-dependent oxidoreductase [Nocardioides sp. C4-1]|uniref:FAD-dependent oxidoreductase n=1 Tax=Nocardioides sp. C4-1 TaxID=3151851 RepID=UPI00326777BC
MRIAIVGLGTSGATLACLLADAGIDVTVVEQADDPRPVGAGLWLQELGQQVLDRLDLLTPLRAVSRPVRRVHMTARGRTIVDLGYDALPGSKPALGVRRGDLFALLLSEVRRRGVPLRLGVPVTGVRPTPSGIAVETAHGDLGSFDLVVGADGSRSAVRRSMNVTSRDRPYAYGALWAVVEDPDGSSTDTLFQGLGADTSTYLGVLPTGRSSASLFWSVHTRDLQVRAGDLDAWRAVAAPYAGPHTGLLDRVTELLPASYRDVVVRSPFRVEGRCGAVLVGDSAHAMSPQLGVGTSLALADAWTLGHALAGDADLPRALATYARRRAAHVRWYQWTTRLMMPAFQSDLHPVAWPRDHLARPLTRTPGVAPVLVGVLCGDRTTPFTRWHLPDGA